MLDKNFAAVDLGPNAFRITDGSVNQSAYAPFNVQVIGGTMYVTYAKLIAEPGEETGADLGYVAEFDLDGRNLRTLEGGGRLNAPWGLAVVPDGFGELLGALLVDGFVEPRRRQRRLARTSGRALLRRRVGRGEGGRHLRPDRD